jgi:hypothetical protein
MSASLDRPIIAGEGKIQIEICCFQKDIDPGPVIERAMAYYGHLLMNREYVDRYSMSDFIGEISMHMDPSNNADRELVSNLRKCF